MNASEAAAMANPFVNSLGMKFVPVPGTTVLMCIRETRRRDMEAFAAENPGTPKHWYSHHYYPILASERQDHPAISVPREQAAAFVNDSRARMAAPTGCPLTASGAARSASLIRRRRGAPRRN